MIAVSAERCLAFWQRTHAISSIGKYSFAFECHQFGFFFSLSCPFFLRRAGISTPITANFLIRKFHLFYFVFFPSPFVFISISIDSVEVSASINLKFSFNTRRWPPLWRRQHPIDRLADESKKIGNRNEMRCL